MYYTFINRFRLLFLAFALILSTFSLFSADCNITQGEDGRWTIVCKGDGIEWTEHETSVTNVVFQDCEPLKAQLSDAIVEVASYLNDISYDVYFQRMNLDDAYYSLRQLKTQYPNVDFSAFEGSLSSISSRLSYLEAHVQDCNDSNERARSLVESIECSDCTSTNNPSGGGSSLPSTCPCPQQFQQVLDKLNEAQLTRKQIDTTFSNLTNFLNETTQTLFTHLQTINQSLYPLSVLTNFYSFAPPYTRLLSNGRTFSSLLYYDSNQKPSSILLNFTLPYLNLNQSASTFSQYLRGYYANSSISSILLGSLSNYESFKYDKIKNLEIEFGRPPVLSSYNSNSGLYGQGDTPYAFLTNYYLTLSSGGSLSGDLATRTNWFDRVESLLAALVFSDTSSTNMTTSSESDAESFKDEVISSFTSLSSTGQSRVSTFKEQTASLIDVYSSFTTAFHDATMPNQIKLFTIVTPGSEDTEITFQDSGFTSFCEICRGITTCLWASTGIFLLYKFLVWAIYKYWGLCVVIFRLASQMFKLS